MPRYLTKKKRGKRNRSKRKVGRKPRKRLSRGGSDPVKSAEAANLCEIDSYKVFKHCYTNPDLDIKINIENLIKLGDPCCDEKTYLLPMTLEEMKAALEKMKERLDTDDIVSEVQQELNIEGDISIGNLIDNLKEKGLNQEEFPLFLKHIVRAIIRKKKFETNKNININLHGLTKTENEIPINISEVTTVAIKQMKRIFELLIKLCDKDQTLEIVKEIEVELTGNITSSEQSGGDIFEYISQRHLPSGVKIGLYIIACVFYVIFYSVPHTPPPTSAIGIRRQERQREQRR